MRIELDVQQERFVYWTARAREVFEEEIKARVPDPNEPGGLVVIGNMENALNTIARFRGTGRVNRSMVLDYFSRVGKVGK